MKLLPVCILAVCLIISTYASSYYSYGSSSRPAPSRSRGNPLGGFLSGLVLGKAAVLSGLAVTGAALVFAPVISAGLTALLAGKKKRSVDSVQHEEMLDDLLNTWDYSLQTGGQCVERMFCHIAADPAEGSTGEKMTKAILANNDFVSLLMSKPGHLAADSLISAGKIGQLSKNPKMCQIMFPECDVDMKLMRSSFEQGYEEGLKAYKKH